MDESSTRRTDSKWTAEHLRRPASLPPAIAASWQRCTGYGVDPLADKLPPISDEDKDIAKKNVLGGIAYTRKALLGYLKSMGKLLKLWNAAVLFVDHSLHVCGYGGSPKLLAELREMNIAFGTDFSEKNAGTNAASMAREEMRSFTLEPDEHFCKLFHAYRCIARGPAKIGVDDFIFALVIMPKDQYTKECSIVLDHVFSAYDAISSQNLVPYAIVANRLLDVLAERQGFSYVIVDKHDRITNVGSNLLKAFHLQGSKTIGIYLQERFPSLEPVLKQCRANPEAAFEVEASDLLIRGEHVSALALPFIADKQRYIAFALRSSLLSGHSAGNPNGTTSTLDDLQGDSVNMRQLRERASRIAACDDTVLIAGESGTGKELVAQAIHNQSNRARKRFETCSCALLSCSHAETILFGRDADHPGLLERVDGGTLLLDEVCDLSLDAQALLARVLDNGTILRLDDMVHKRVDVRFIATTNRNLSEAVKSGALRRDFLYRVCDVRIDVPPLRDHLEDAPAIAWNCFECELERAPATRAGRGRRIEKTDFDAFAAYDWPGNVRELEHVVHQMVVELDLTDEPFAKALERVIGQNDLPAPSTSAVASRELAGREEQPFGDYERELLAETLKRNRGNKTATARELGMARQTLYSRLKTYGIS